MTLVTVAISIKSLDSVKVLDSLNLLSVCTDLVYALVKMLKHRTNSVEVIFALVKWISEMKVGEYLQFLVILRYVSLLHVSVLDYHFDQE